MFFVALAVEGREGGVVAVGKGEHGAGGGNQRRRLVIAAVESAEAPVEPGDEQGDADAGSGGVFDELAFEAGLAETGGEGEPRGGFEVVGKIFFDDAAVGGVRLGDGRGPAAIVEDGCEEVAVV